jgi:hypothetical protein
MCEEKKMVTPTLILFLDELEEFALHERVEASRRLVEQQQFGSMLETLDDPYFLPVAIGEVFDATIQLELHQLSQLVHALGAVLRVETGRVLEQVDDLHAVVVEDLGGKVPYVPSELSPYLTQSLPNRCCRWWMDQ